jgi:hypothetical protein
MSEMMLISSLGQRKLMLAFWTFSHCALHRRRATGAGKRSAVCYVKGEAAFWAFNQMFRMWVQRLFTPFKSELREILKMFLIILEFVYAKLIIYNGN